jgi:glycosyltransferase involved in cell wall biosynthesis
MVSIVIPAHNEAQVVGRLLRQLVSETNDLDIVVVANGCTDATAEVAASFGAQVRVLTLPVASKREALIAGNQIARGFPRLYVDADVELGVREVGALAAALQCPGVLAASVNRRHEMTGRPWQVRWYYDIWSRLPEVQSGLFGRGVIGVNARGFQRIAELPALLADDLVASLSFANEERSIVASACVVVHPPRTFGDMLRARTRAKMGSNQIHLTTHSPRFTARTKPVDLLRIGFENPRLIPRVAFFVVIGVLIDIKARRLAAKHGYTTWLRDESSRAEPAWSLDISS